MRLLLIPLARISRKQWQRSLTVKGFMVKVEDHASAEVNILVITLGRYSTRIISADQRDGVCVGSRQNVLKWFEIKTLNN
jgi:hypothetical protein